MRKTFQSGTPWEPIVGYSRAVRVDNIIHVSGTTATDERGELVGTGDVYLQAQQALKNIEKALNALGGRREDIVRTRIFVSDREDWEAVGRAHGEFFQGIFPATSMVEARLILPEMLVEIEAEAILSP
jgi:enamine deaminase RidA (YjgF/YER057c/UK114 family)